MAKCGLLLQLLSALLILPAVISTSAATACHPDDLRALRDFADNLSGDGAVLLRAMWSGDSCCGWEGVGCDDISGRVTTLWLPGRGLAGPIQGAASLAGLAWLESLNLANNKLVGAVPFPSWIGELGCLCYLDLSHNASPLLVKRNRRALLTGQPNTITGTNNSVRSGSGNTVSGDGNTVISGDNNVVSGNNNTVTGNNNTVSGSNHVVNGDNLVVTGG